MNFLKILRVESGINNNNQIHFLSNLKTEATVQIMMILLKRIFIS